MRNTILRKLGRVKRYLAMTGGAVLLAACSVGGGDGQRVDTSGSVQVALLVPSGGTEAENLIARDIERGARLALAEQGADNVELQVYATGADPERALAQANMAVANGADLIIGPLFSTEVAAVSNIKSVPILALSNNSEVTTENVYILGSSFETIANRVIGYGKATGNNRLGIVASDDLSGNQGAVAATRAANRNGVAVVAASKYPLTETGIAQNAPSIADQLRQAGADSVMFTDTPTGGLIFMTDALAQNGVSSADALFMGLTRWDVSESVLGQPTLSGGVFAVPDPAQSQAFEARYQNAYNSEPHALASLGYDGVKVAKTLVADAVRSFDGTPFGSEDLQRRGGYQGAFGDFRLLSNGQADREMAIMQVSNGDAVVVSAAP